MKKFGLAFLSVIMAIFCLLSFAACSNDKPESGGSLFADEVYVSLDTLNGGNFSKRINEKYPDHSKLFKIYMGLKPEQFFPNVYRLVNHYHVDYAYSMNAEPDDVVKNGYVFGGWYLDKECTVGNYLTKSTFTKKYNEKMASETHGSIPLYARWLKPGEREIVFEVEDTCEFAEGTTVNNQQRITLSKEQYSTPEKLQAEIAKFPKVNLTDKGKIIDGSEKEFKKWKVDFNGLRYDYKDLEFLPMTNQTDEGVFDAFMDVPWHNFSYSNFFRDGVQKPYAVVRPELKSKIDDGVDVFFNENGGKWNPEYGKNCDRIIDKYTGISNNSFELSIYNFVNHGISSKQREYFSGKPKEVPYKPNTNDITKDGKVFAGWYLDKECTPSKYFCRETWDTLVYPNLKNLEWELDLYARWIDVGQREIVFENNGTFSRILFDKTSTNYNQSTIDGYKIDFNGLLFDYSKNEYPFVPETVSEGEFPDITYTKPIAKEYYEKFTFANFIQNGDGKPYAFLVK